MVALNQLLAVAVGGCVGAVGRYLLSVWAIRWWGTGFPYATLIVNVAGCLAMGAAMELAQTRAWFSETLRLCLVVGFLGALTTFSSFGYETLSLADRGQLGLALANGVLNLVLGLLAVGLGRSMVG